MNIKGRGKSALDIDLVGQLALKQQSGGTISQAEVKSLINDVKCDLQDEFSYSSRGLANAERGVTNAFKLALSSGWIKGDTAASMIEAFVQGEGSEGLKDIVKDIRSENRRGGGSTSYSSYTPTYTPTSSSSSWGT